MHILSRHHPRALELSGERCSALGLSANALSMEVKDDQVELCTRPKRRCARADALVLECASPLAITLPTKKPRRYGRRLSARVEGGELHLIAQLPLEPYVAGVVNSELARGPEAARQAQAVLARSFAVRATAHPRHKDADLCDLTHCQAFKGVPEAPVAPQEQTRGWVLRNKSGEVAETYYHSTCGGHTIDAKALWPGADPALVGVSDTKPSGEPWGAASPHSYWVHELSDKKLARALRPIFRRRVRARRLRVKKIDPLRFVLSDARGRVEVSAERLHVVLGRALGWSKVKSNDLEIERAGRRRFRIRGHGLGHRVGLCQYGAMGRAEAGATAEQILKAYFPNYRLDKSGR